MEKKTTLKGMWWVKENEVDKFVGILTYGGGFRPTLEIFPKDFEFDAPKVPDGSTLYGDVFGDSRKVQAVTLLKCKSQNNWGSLEVGAYIYKQEFVYADCVAIGLLLNDDEITQVQSPQEIYLTCPGLDEYSMVRTVEYVWKENIPKDRAYRVSDLDKIVYTQPESIVIQIDIGTITIHLGRSSTTRDLSSHYGIHINLSKPTPMGEVNSLIYSEILSFLSVMTGQKEYIRTHNITINSKQTNNDTLSIELNYGHFAHSTRETEYSILQALMLGREENLRKFVTLFPKWRENFAFVKYLAFYYMQMAEPPTKTNLLQAFPHIERYALDRLKKKGNLACHLNEVIHSIAEYFSFSSVFCQHFPCDRRCQIASHIANFRNNLIHPRSKKECKYSIEEVYAYIAIIMRAIFLKEMEYTYKDLDKQIEHWQSWRQLEVD